jgi:hypothetical protein
MDQEPTSIPLPDGAIAEMAPVDLSGATAIGSDGFGQALPVPLPVPVPVDPANVISEGKY